MKTTYSSFIVDRAMSDLPSQDTAPSRDRRESWRVEEMFLEGDIFFERLLSAIAGARHTVEMEMYIFTNDQLAELFLGALGDAARRGLTVKVLVDGVGSYGSILSNAERLRAAGVEIRVYHPVRISALVRRLFRLPRLSPLRRFFATLNRRNHRKVCIVDMHEAWLGSFNISAVHSRRLSGDAVWRDTGVRVVGGGIRDLRRAFERVWYSATERRRWSWVRRVTAGRLRAPELVKLNWKGHQRRRNFGALLQRIKRAQERVWITNPYFVPHGALLRALTDAAGRGVDVRLLVPRRSDVFFMPWVGAYFYEPLLRERVRIWEYRRGILHAKSLLIDNWALIGSSNLNQRSLRYDLEVDVVLSKPSSLAFLEDAFHHDLEGADELHSLDLAGRPWWQQFVAKVCFAYRRWL